MNLIAILTRSLNQGFGTLTVIAKLTKTNRVTKEYISMEDRNTKIANKVKSLCNTHGWSFEQPSSEKPLPLTLTKDDQKISVHLSPVTEGRLVCIEKWSEDDRGSDSMEKYEDVDTVVKRVRLWMQ